MEGPSRILWSMENCLQQFPALAGRWSVGKYPQESESRFRFTVANHGGFDQCKSASAQCWCKKGADNDQAIGRSRGGLTTKVHAAVDKKGRPVKLLLSRGNLNDITLVPRLVDGLRTCIHNQRMPDGRGILLPCKAKKRRQYFVYCKIFQRGRPAKDPLRRCRMVVNTGSLLSGGQKPANAWGAPVARVIRSRAVYSSSLAAVSPRV